MCVHVGAYRWVSSVWVTLMHSYHGERESVAEPQEDAFQTLTAESRSEQNKTH